MIYLDHAAATPVSRKALLAMRPYFDEQFFNPSSPYLPAKHVRDNYEFAKGQIAHAIGAKGADLVITAGATESINLAFTAVFSALAAKDAQRSSAPKPAPVAKTITQPVPEILILSTEHPAVIATAENVAKKVAAKVIKIKVDHTGLIDIKDFKNKINDNTIFVSIALANNELGTIQPLAEISQIIARERENRLKSGITRPLYLHSDASQALNLLDISVSRLGVDLLTINSAKIGGPKGIGALYVAHNVKLQPIISGGGQEMGLRSGTENVPAVIGFAAAAEETKAHLMSSRKKYQLQVQILKNKLEKCQVKPLFLGNSKHQLANFCPVSFPGIDAERLIYLLEEQEVYLSTGAACAANKGAISHVLKAIGLSDLEIAGSLRISLGVLNTDENVNQAGELIIKAVEQEARRIGLLDEPFGAKSTADAGLANNTEQEHAASRVKSIEPSRSKNVK